MRCDAPTRAARSIAMNDTQSPPKSDVQDRYFGLLRCVGCFPGVCSEDALKGIFDDHRTARRALKSADIAENSIERSWSQHHVRFTLRAVWQTPVPSFVPKQRNFDFATQEALDRVPRSISACTPLGSFFHRPPEPLLISIDVIAPGRMPEGQGLLVLKHRT